jgi:hypothetical protein
LGELLLGAVVELGHARALVRRHFLRVLEEYLIAYLDGAGLRDDPRGRCSAGIGRGAGKLTRTVLLQANVYTMIRRLQGSKPRSATIASEPLGSRPISRIAAYLKNGGTLEKAAAMANHASTARRSFTTGGATR